jgi:hypothetical protein
MWKKEIKTQMGINTARARRGIREKSGEKTDKFKKGHKSDSTKVTLGKRTKTATDYGKKNTSTFKT